MKTTRILTLLSLAFFASMTGCSAEADQDETKKVSSKTASKTSGKQLFYPPKSSRNTEVTQLAYLESPDAVQGKDYACLVYKETNTKSEKWNLKIELKGMRTTNIDPESPVLRKKMSEAAVDGMDYFVMGASITPTDNDPRLVENRIYFDESLNPEYLQIHLVTRNADGSPTEEQIARVEWPAGRNDGDEKQVLSAPKSSGSTLIDELAYINSYDVIANSDYAYLAYKATNTKTGKWILKIKAKVTSSTSIDPNDRSLRRSIMKAAKEGKDYITTGFSLTPKDNDPRLVENRVYFDKSLNPTRVEIHIVTRNVDGSPTEKKVAKFKWPA